MTADPGERRRIEQLAIRAYPEEACGVILERGSVRLLLNCVNAAPEADRRVRFSIAPADIVRIHQLLSDGWTLDTIWHSHPDHPAEFSNVDAAAAMLDDEPQFPFSTYKVVAIHKGSVAGWAAVQWAEHARAFAPVPAWPDSPRVAGAAA